jgi:LysM repeat protein
MITMRRILICLCLVVASTAVQAQDKNIIQTYIETYRELAIAEMQRTGVPASIKLAQGIHETMAGTSVLVNKSNNHFGIKCKSTWKGESVSHDDDARGECFRKYTRAEDSYKDHSDFLRGNQRYASLFTLDPEDYKSWAYGLKKAGYATNPKYPLIIIKLIEDYNLQDYTLIALGKKPAGDIMLAKRPEPLSNEVPVVAAVQREEVTAPAAPAKSYPDGEFRINDTKVVFVRKGTSFLAVAQQYNIPLKRLFEFNDDMPEEEEAAYDQLLFLQRKRKTGATDFHLVKAGETIYDIAQEEGIRLESLLEYNHLTEEQDPAAGETLYLKKKAPSRPRLAATTGDQLPAAQALPVKASDSYLTHVVQPKETLYSISRKYQVTTESITEWNGLVAVLKPGQTLKIYK